MSILFVGDMHGDRYSLMLVDKCAKRIKATAIVQVGDLGTFWPNNSTQLMDEAIIQRSSTVPIYSCLGNHDNWAFMTQLWKDQGKPDKVELAPGSNVFFIPRNTLLTIEGIKILFFGGAESTDKMYRIENLSWWAGETASREEFDTLFDCFNNQKPDILVTHEAPEFVSLRRNDYGSGSEVDRSSQPTVRGLSNIYKVSTHRPRLHMFGHHHLLKKWEKDETTFCCCGLNGEYWRLTLNNDEYQLTRSGVRY